MSFSYHFTCQTHNDWGKISKGQVAGSSLELCLIFTERAQPSRPPGETEGILARLSFPSLALPINFLAGLPVLACLNQYQHVRLPVMLAFLDCLPPRSLFFPAVPRQEFFHALLQIKSAPCSRAAELPVLTAASIC